MREINKITDLESFKSAINRLDTMTQDPSKIRIDFQKSDSKAKDFFEKFFEIADGKPQWDD